MLGVSAEQEELRASVRRFLADRAPMSRVRELMETETGTDRAVWEQAGAQLGLQGLAIPEAYGGAGFTFAEQAIVLEELGAALYGGPYLASAVLAATALLASPDEGARGELLPGIASGETIATLAFTEDDGSWDPAAIRLSAVKDGDGLAAGRAQELRARRRHGRADPGRRGHRRRPVAVRRGQARRPACAGPRCPRWTRPGSWPGSSSPG